jgi:pilus assembly protein Flp/PilA
MLKFYVSIQSRLAELRDEEGQTMAEYGVVLAVITVGIIVALTALGTGISGALDSVVDKLTPGG